MMKIGTGFRALAGVLLLSASACGDNIVYNYTEEAPHDDELPAGIIETVAGNGTAGTDGNGGPATEAQLNNPRDIWADPLGNFYIADNYNYRIQRVDGVTGEVTTAVVTGDSVGNNRVREIVMTAAGDFIFLDLQNHRVRKAEAFTGEITTILGTGTLGYNGDGMLGPDTQVNRPHGLALDGAGNLFVADFDNDRVRRLDAVTQKVSTIAGTGTGGYSGDGGLATEAEIDVPSSGAFDPAGSYYFCDAGNHVVRRIDVVTGIITTVAGTGENGSGPDGGLATETALQSPRGIGFDAKGNLYIADSPSQRIRRVDAVTGIMTTVAGDGTVGYSGDGGPATEAQLNQPQGLEVDRARNLLYIADSDNNVVRRLRLPD